MRAHLLLLAVPACVLGVSGIVAHELGNPGAVRAELSTVSPRVLAPVEARLPAAAAAKLSERDLRAAFTETALSALEDRVVMQSHPDALRLAFQAYFAYRSEHPSQVKKPYLYFVDYGLDNHTPRGYVFDMSRLEVVDGPFTVAHGRGSSSSGDGIPTRFSNRPGSYATSLGLYLAQETYGFSGTSSGRRYRSVGLRLRGLSGLFNSTARERGVVVHGAPYVTASRAGRSEGCPAMEQERADRLIPMIANGGLVFLFSPEDDRWLREDPWAEGALQNFATAPAPRIAG